MPLCLKSHVLVQLLIVLASLLAPSARPCAAESDIPPLLWSSDPFYEYPRWVEADAAFLNDGTFNPQLFHPQVLDILEGLFAAEPVEGCIALDTLHVSYVFFASDDTSTFAGMAASADFVLHGRVTAIAFGFRGTSAGRLLQIEPIEVEAEEPELAVYYVHWPAGRFEAGNKTICKSDYRYPPEAPEIGDEIVVIDLYRDYADPFVETMEGLGVALLRKDSVALVGFPEESFSSPSELLCCLGFGPGPCACPGTSDPTATAEPRVTLR